MPRKKRVKRRQVRDEYTGPRIGEDGVTQSMLACWVDCPQRADYKFANYAAPGGTKDAFTFGSLVHYICEQDVKAFRTGKQPPCPVADLCAGWRNSDEAPDDTLPEAWEGLLAKVLPMMTAYRERWAERDTKTKWLAPEQEFDVEWQGFRLRGKIDGACVISGDLWLVERKTTSGAVDDAYEDKLGFDFQSLFYATAAEILLDRPVKGIVYDVIRKPTIRQTQKETLAEYSVRVAEKYAEAPRDFFARYEVNFSKARRKRFEAELLAKLTAFAEWYDGDRDTWRNEGACVKRWKCEYISACAADSVNGLVQGHGLFSELGG